VRGGVIISRRPIVNKTLESFDTTFPPTFGNASATLSRPWHSSRLDQFTSLRHTHTNYLTAGQNAPWWYLYNLRRTTDGPNTARPASSSFDHCTAVSLAAPVIFYRIWYARVHTHEYSSRNSDFYYPAGYLLTTRFVCIVVVAVRGDNNPRKFHDHYKATTFHRLAHAKGTAEIIARHRPWLGSTPQGVAGRHTAFTSCLVLYTRFLVWNGSGKKNNFLFIFTHLGDGELSCDLMN